MRFNEFKNLPNSIPEKSKIGDKFLSENLASQKNNKRKNDGICYYEIISVSEIGNIEYIIKYDILEDDNNE